MIQIRICREEEGALPLPPFENHGPNTMQPSRACSQVERARVYSRGCLSSTWSRHCRQPGGWTQDLKGHTLTSWNSQRVGAGPREGLISRKGPLVTGESEKDEVTHLSVADIRERGQQNTQGQGCLVMPAATVQLGPGNNQSPSCSSRHHPDVDPGTGP